MKKMKQLTALLLALLLAACSAAGAPHSGTQPAQAQASSAAQAGPPAPEVYFLQDLTPCVQDSASPDGKCYYFPVTAWQYQVGNYIVELDGVTGRAEPICHDPACSHSDESCSAFFPMNLGGRENVYLLDGQLLVTLSGNAWADGDLGFLTLCDVNGANRREVCKLGQWESFSGGMATDGQAVYATIQNEAASTLQLVRIELATGQRTALYTWDTTVPADRDDYAFVFPTSASLFAAAGRSLYLRGYELACVRYDPEKGEGLSLSQSIPPDTLSRYDLDTDTLTPVLTGKAEETYGLVLGKELYQIRAADMALLRTQLDTGSVEVLRAPYTDRPLPVPGQPNGTDGGETEVYGMAPMIDGAIDGLLLITNEIPGEGVQAEEYAVDPATGEETPLPLRAVGHWRSQPLYIGGRCGGKLLVKMDEVYRTAVAQGPDGSTGTYETVDFQWALLSIDDYLAGRPNYTPVDGPGPM